MSRLMLPENQIMDFELITQKSVPDYFDTNYLIYFVLDGELDFVDNNTPWRLKTKDFLLVDSCRHHSYHADRPVLVGRFIISMELLSRYYNIHQMEIVCNSVTCDAALCDEFRRLLERCFGYYYGRQAGDGRSIVHLNSIYYQIIEYLLSNFARAIPDELPQNDNPDAERINDIISYIHANFKHPISLTDLAERMYLSTAYVSRYIKKKLGKNLGEYLTDIRLDFAVRDLENTDKSIARIALDNGFPNISSFNKAFKEHYSVTPKSYQETYMARKKAGLDDEGSEGVKHWLMESIADLPPYDREEKDTEIFENFTVDTRESQPLKKNWNKMMNLGRVIALLRGDVQEHVLFIKNTFDIEYIRIWDIYDDGLQLNLENEGGRHNFSKLDKALDFLCSNSIRPYIELGCKPIILLDNYESYISYVEREIVFKELEDYGHYLESLMIHLVNRYGAQEVSQWIFELWSDPRLFKKNGDGDAYFSTLEMSCRVIKKIVPGARVGGAYDREYGYIFLRDFAAEWSRRKVSADFLSLYCYRSRGAELINGEVPYKREAQKHDFLFNYLTENKALLKKYGVDVPVYVSEWNFTVINRNVLNDSCFKGAYVMKNLIDLYDQTELLGYWFATDLFVECEEAPKLLDGCCGLLSYDGIRKPAFYAFDFMNHLEELLLGRSKHMMVTSNGYDSYTIVCHNYKHMDVQYFLRDEQEVTVEEIPLLFPDTSRLKLNIRINHIKNGFYYIKTHSVCAHSGSVQDEWKRMGFIENLGRQDMDYLRGICVPHITVFEYPVKNHTLEITLTLDAQEIQRIHIYRQLRE